jgi:hypothetical protein
VGPICKHAFALAAAIDRARHGRTQPDRERLDRGPSAELTSDIADWARRHAETPARVLRAVFGLYSSMRMAGRACGSKRV